MGFLSAICSLGAATQGEGLEPYLSFPLEKGGKLIRVALRVTDPMAKPLDIHGVASVDLADERLDTQMKLKYLFRVRAGSAAAWGFSPIHKMGKPKKDPAVNRQQILGAGGDWSHDKNSHLYKVRNKTLIDFEKEEAFTEGSVERIMAELPQQLDELIEYLDPKSSHIIIFGVADGDRFLYPGEIPAFIDYFKKKLYQVMGGSSQEGKVRCSLCHRKTQPFLLSKTFKFATADKVNVLHGLLDREELNAFPVCKNCFEQISSGRVRLQMKLNNNTVLPKINIWTLPEAIGGNGGPLIKHLIDTMEKNAAGDQLKSPEERTEERYFSHLAREGQGLVFHFIFWERNNAQELVHLMVEDVPPERLAMLERKWGESITTVFGQLKNRSLLSVDWAIKSLYKTLSVFAGRSEADKQIFRDFSLKVIGKMLKGEQLPGTAFKRAVVERAARLVFESSNWDEVSKELSYAMAWVDYMNRINKEVGV